MKEESSLLSVGIDVGTTTTHMVVCKLKAANTSYGFNVPKLAIEEREIVYESPVFYTPFQKGLIDGNAIHAILLEQYKLANITASDIKCGAIIITGESAKVTNAQSVIKNLSNLAGDFVAASAGPHLESILAAKGSGAFSYSFENNCSICNVDIGGGTTNVAICRNGKIEETWCFSIGGRFLQLDEQNSILAVTEAGKYLASHIDIDVSIGRKLSQKELSRIVSYSAKLLVKLVSPSGQSLPQHKALFLTNLPSANETCDQYWFSGGVANLMHSDPSHPSQFGDIGPLLASCLVEQISKNSLNAHLSENSIRATVIGAGSHTVQLSGHTIYVPEALLPVKDVPIIRCPDFESEHSLDAQIEYLNTLAAFLSKKVEEYNCSSIALVLPKLDFSRYNFVKASAKELAKLLDCLALEEPLIFIVQTDAAMALGQQLELARPERQFMVIDGINTESGDFVELGKPISKGLTIPITVKTLLFP